VNEVLMAHRKAVPVLNLVCLTISFRKGRKTKPVQPSALMPQVLKLKSAPGWHNTFPTAPVRLILSAGAERN
jgi:hypothetical protein